MLNMLKYPISGYPEFGDGYHIRKSHGYIRISGYPDIITSSDHLDHAGPRSSILDSNVLRVNIHFTIKSWVQCSHNIYSWAGLVIGNLRNLHYVHTAPGISKRRLYLFGCHYLKGPET